jgi:hypothetical protein
MVWWMQPAFGRQMTMLAFRGRSAAREKVVVDRIDANTALRRGVMGEDLTYLCDESRSGYLISK